VRYFTSFQDNKDIVNYLSTFRYLHRQRIFCSLTETVNYHRLAFVRLAGFHAEIVYALDTFCRVDPHLLQGVKYLSFSHPYKEIEQAQLPESIQSVFVRFVESSQDSYSLDFLPPSLTALHLRGGFNQSILPGSLPLTLNMLELGAWFEKEIEPGSLPNSIISLLFVGSSFQGQLSAKNLPMQLCHLKLNTLYNSDQVILDEMQYLTHFEFNFNVWETDKCKLSDLHLPKSLYLPVYVS
jgi:hypothetical protein